MKIEIEQANGDFEEVEVPVKFEVCGRCDGKGSHVNPSIDGHGITSEEWNGPDWDDESRETYLSGGYDVPCYDCKGLRVVEVPNFDVMSDEMKKHVEAHLDEEANAIAEREAERRAGCG